MSRTQRAVNPIDVVEAAYELARDDRDWLRHVAETVRPLIDGGLGVTAYYFDLATPPATWFEGALTLDVDPRVIRDMAELVTNTPKITAATHLDPEPLGAAIESAKESGLGDPRNVPWIAALFARLGVRDYAALRTIEPGRKGICITAGQHHDCSIDQRSRRLWARVAAHIAAARRLRSALATSPDHCDVEAVLTPSGKVDHADGEGRPRSARDALRDAVLRQERARGNARREEPERATEAWTALVRGRWSLVDQFERNGRRYIVARRNEHQLADPRALTSRERAVAHLASLGKANKLIAYELGIAESTVGNHLAAAMRKLGATSRVDLIRLVAELAGASTS